VITDLDKGEVVDP